MRYSVVILFFFVFQFSYSLSEIDSLESLISEKTDTSKIDLLNNLSFKYWNKAPLKGLEYGEQAELIAKEFNYPKGEGKALICQGINYWASGKYEQALAKTFSAMKIYERIDNKNGLHSGYNNLGLIYHSTKDYEESLTNYLIAKKLALETENFRNEVSINNNIGSIYIEQGKYEKSLDVFYDNLKLIDEYNVPFQRSATLANIGTSLMKLGKEKEALKYMKQAFNLDVENEHYNYAAMAGNQIGKYYLENGEENEAIKYLMKAESLALKSHALIALQLIQENLSEYYRQNKDLEKALEYKDKYIITNDSLYNEKSSKQMAEMHTKFEVEQKEKENDILRISNQVQELKIDKEVTLRNSFIGVSVFVFISILILFNRFHIKKEANRILSDKNHQIELQKIELELNNKKLTDQYQKLEILNATKNKFFKIIAHDLKSPLSGILSLSELLSKDYYEHGDEEKIAILSLLHKSSKNTFNLLANLLQWAQSQTNGITIQKEKYNLYEVFETSTKPFLLNAENKHISISNKIDKELMIMLDKQTMSTVFGNLVNNAIKFTPNNGLITFTNQTYKDHITLHILDSGVGMTHETIDKLFLIDESISTKGTNNEKGTGLGLILCDEFVQKNGGSITVKSKVNEGSEFIITLPC